MVTKRKGPSQTWAIGATVQVGSRQYVVTGMEPPRAKGEGPCWVLDTPDHSKTYEYVAFRGLRLIRGDLVRPARAARRKAARAAAKAALAHQAQAALSAAEQAADEQLTNTGFFRKLLSRFIHPVNSTTMVQKPGSGKGR